MPNEKGYKYPKVAIKKRAMLKALEKHLGIVVMAAKETGIDRNSHYQWMSNDPEYRAQVLALNDVVLDFAESHLYKRIREGSDSCTMFLLKCRGKSRGYIERIEYESAPKELIEANPVFGDD